MSSLRKEKLKLKKIKDDLLLEFYEFFHDPMLSAYLGKEAATGECLREK